MSSSTAPSIVQPKAVDRLTEKWMLAAFAISATARISPIISACDLRTFLIECVSDIEKGIDIPCTPASAARTAPCALGTSATTFRPLMVFANATISAVSAICGNSEGGTKLPTSISRTPASASALIHAFLASSGIIRLVDCRPSRGPTSDTRILVMGVSPDKSMAARRGRRPATRL